MGDLKAFTLEATKETPTVVLDADGNKFEVTGRSFPLNAKGFYLPILEWLEKYAENPNPKTEFLFKLEYFNTPSSKSISDILKKMKEIKDGGNEVVVYWYYEEDDIDILDLGHVFARTVGMDFEFKEYKD
ncbi:MAG: DUF1987 domain-containing protein [Flavobacteriales bacterium]|nr:DUF1987 domain-containing protein [Flavobacteriales bacterium]